MCVVGFFETALTPCRCSALRKSTCRASPADLQILPHSVVLGFSCLTWLTFLANTLYCAYENKARAAGKRDGNVAKYEELIRSGKSVRRRQGIALLRPDLHWLRMG